MAKPRLLVVSPLDIFPPNTGGMSRTHNIMKSLLPRYDVALACPTLAQPEAQDLPVRIHQLARPGKAQFVSPFFVRKLRAVIKREVPDVILASFVWMVPAVWLARLPAKTPIFVDTQNVETERLRGAGARWWRLAALFERLATRLATRVFVVSEEDGDLLRRLGMPREKAVLLPNGYDDETFYPDLEAGLAFRRAIGVGDREQMLLYFGHMGYAPNQEALQAFHDEVLATFDRESAEYRLVVAGRHSEELGRQYRHPRMQFVGVVDRIQDAINAADVVVVPLQRGGGTRTKIIESAACGTPVVSTTAGAAGLQREAFGDLLAVVDGWDKFACATAAAARRPRDVRAAPAGFPEHYAWRSIAHSLDLEGGGR